MRILHISDFHLDYKDKEDNVNHVVEPLIKRLEKVIEEKQIDLIFFTGDLVNIGGKNYSGLDEAFLDFEETLIEPLLKITKLTKDSFFFVPGNHDINRDLDSKISEEGLVKVLVSQESLNNFFKKPEGIDRIKEYQEFEEYFYKDSKSKIKLSEFQSTFKTKKGDYNVGICCLNSSWRCFDSNSDKGKILIGEKQIIDGLKDLNDCDLKIALCHHHFDFLQEFDKEIVESLLKQDFNLFFSGHTHRNKAGYIQDPDGQLFSFCASGTLSSSIRNPERKYENGFSTIDYDMENRKIISKFYKAEYPKREFIINSSIGNDGVWEVNIPFGEEVEQILLEQKLIKQITCDSIPEIDCHLLSHSTDTQAPKSLNELFVMPNIVVKEEFDVEKDDKTINSLDKIINSEKNFIVFGTKESGKTILIDKLLIETLESNKQHHQIPATIDFKELQGNLLKLIREFWSKPSDEAKDILANYKILLFIDNISFEDEDIYKLKALKEFLVENPNVRFIATYQQFYDEDFPMNLELVSMFSYDTITLKQFKTKQIKELIQKWFPDSNKYDTPKKLETLTNAFLALNLPRTPFAVSMFLWIIEKQENFKPINNSTLIENFIEKILKKHDIRESQRERFGYENKIWIISHIAYNMLKGDKENYSLSYSIFTNTVDKYLKDKKFEDFKTDRIVEILLDSGIFLRDNGDVRFRFSCFFEFFLMKQMEKDSEFKEEVLDENNFLNFSNEIDYFSGIHRGETKLLKLIITRLKSGFSDLEKMINQTKVEKGYENYDGFFISRDNKGKEKPSLINQLNEEKVVTFLPSNKPSEEDLEVIEDKKLELQKQEKGITKKEQGNNLKNLGKLLVLALRVINNSEEVLDKKDPDLKLNSYSTALEKSILFAILHKAVFELFLKNQDKLSKDKIEEFTTMNKFLPLLHEMFLFDNIGSQKLTSVIRDKINLDKNGNVSDFEKALSVFLYADIRGTNYNLIVSDFIKNVKTKYIEDLIFFKLVTYYFYRAKDDETDNFYLNLIADLMIKSKGYQKSKKSEIMESYKKKKKERLSQDIKKSIG
ncbi:metallophosphoesterase [Yeosuana marina]|uniref:metallophosphoesterase n=1 Tax=Yeosuana marina TaxID=1565536 RepID=UPI0030C841CF